MKLTFNLENVSATPTYMIIFVTSFIEISRHAK